MVQVMAADGAGGDGDPTAVLVGSWHVTSAVTSIVLSIEPSGEALGLFIENGAHSLWRTRWKKMEGGLLIEGMPMFRIWPGRHREEARVEMEPISDEMDVSGGLRQFPLAFFMRKVGPVGRGLPSRAIPKTWESGKPGPDWDQKAGRRRPAK